MKGAIFFPFKQKDFPLRKEIFSLILKAFLKEPSRYFFVSQQWKQQNNVWNLLKVINKDTWTTSFFLVSVLLTLNRFQTFFCRFHCWLWTFKSCPRKWEIFLLIELFKKYHLWRRIPRFTEIHYTEDFVPEISFQEVVFHVLLPWDTPFPKIVACKRQTTKDMFWFFNGMTNLRLYHIKFRLEYGTGVLWRQQCFGFF